MSKPKSRISKSKLTKKAKVPKWAIVLGVAVLTGVAIFSIYRAFASDPIANGTYQSRTIYCWQGHCSLTRVYEHQEPQQAFVHNDPVHCPNNGHTVGVSYRTSAGVILSNGRWLRRPNTKPLSGDLCLTNFVPNTNSR